MHNDLKKRFGMGRQGWTRNGGEGSKQKGEKIRALQVVLVVKNPPVHAGDARDTGSIPGSGRRSPGEGNGYSLQSFCLENLVDRGAWRGIVHGVAKSQTWLSTALQGERNQERKVGWFTCKLTLSHTHTHTSSLHDSGSQPELHVRITWETLETQMPRSYPKPVTSGSLRLRSKPQTFFKCPRKLQCAAKVENNSAGGYAYCAFFKQV